MVSSSLGASHSFLILTMSPRFICRSGMRVCIIAYFGCLVNREKLNGTYNSLSNAPLQNLLMQDFRLMLSKLCCFTSNSYKIYW